MVCEQKGLKEVEEDGETHLILWGVELFWEYRTLVKRDVRNGERCMYFVCDFNGK